MVSKKTNWTWLPAVGTVVGVLVVAVTATTYLNTKFEGIYSRLDKDEAAIKAMNSNEDEKTKALVQQLLASAITSLPDNPSAALKATNVASALVTTLAQQKRPADAQYFESVVQSLNEITAKTNNADVQESAYSARASLADYRSAIVPPPVGINVWTFKNLEHAVTVYPNTRIVGGNFDVRNITGDAVQVGKSNPNVHHETPPAMPYIEGMLIQNGQQTLDGVDWEKVVFVNMRIRYRGGPLRLRNVLFVNCTFDVPPTSHGAQLADYASLLSNDLEIG